MPDDWVGLWDGDNWVERIIVVHPHWMDRQCDIQSCKLYHRVSFPQYCLEDGRNSNQCYHPLDQMK